MKRRRKVFAVLPTLLTLGNAVCGFGAVTYAARGGSEVAAALFTASCLIFLAMVFDVLDGSTARWANQTSEFGAQLDSLCDAISFGVAPAFLMLQYSAAAGYHSRLLWLVAALYVVCAVLRLARFNVEPDDPTSPKVFKGLPSPAAAGTVASFPLMVHGLAYLEYTGRDLPWTAFASWFGPVTVWLLPPITFAVACLMVSRFRYAHLVHLMVRGRRNRRHVILIVFAVGVVFVVPQVVVPLLFCMYTFSAPIQSAWARIFARRGVRSPETADVEAPPIDSLPARSNGAASDEAHPSSPR